MSLSCPFCGGNESLTAGTEVKELVKVGRFRTKEEWGGFSHLCLNCGRQMKIKLTKGVAFVN